MVPVGDFVIDEGQLLVDLGQLLVPLGLYIELHVVQAVLDPAHALVILRACHAHVVVGDVVLLARYANFICK